MRVRRKKAREPQQAVETEGSFGENYPRLIGMALENVIHSLTTFYSKLTSTGLSLGEKIKMCKQIPH